MDKGGIEENINEASDETEYFNRGLEEEVCSPREVDFENLEHGAYEPFPVQAQNSEENEQAFQDFKNLH